MFQKAVVPKPPPYDWRANFQALSEEWNAAHPEEAQQRNLRNLIAELKATPIQPRTPEQIEERDKAACELRMQKHRIEQARAQVEAQRAKEAADRSVEAAKNIDSEELGRRWFSKDFCPFVQSKRI